MLNPFRHLIPIALSATGLLAQTFSGGTGSALDPYRISDKNDLKTLSEDTLYWRSSFVQTADIAFNSADFDSGGAFHNAGKGFSRIGWGVSSGSATRAIPFRGRYDGGNHAISGIRIRGESFRGGMGLFGYIDTGTVVENLNLINVDVSGYDQVGGLVGRNYGNIANCSVTGVVSGDNDIGGLVGRNGRKISDCQANVKVKGRSFVGGLVGNANGLISQSSASGNVSGERNVGGLLGACSCELTASASSGNVDGDNSIGGLIGNLESIGITDFARMGWVAGVSASGTATGRLGVGGLIGSTRGGNVDSSSASGKASGDSLVGGLIGFSVEIILKNSSATGPVTGKGYVGGLVGRSEHESSRARDSIFLCIARGEVRGDYAVGGLIGQNRHALIANSAAMGNVIGKELTGGLVGDGNGYAGSISGCYATGSVTGYYQTGGLVGQLGDGPISDSYAGGSVTGVDYAGGLVGDARTSDKYLTNCYATGFVVGNGNAGGLVGGGWREGPSLVVGSFWDSQSTGMAISKLGTGKTTAEMKAAATFSDTGWDLVDTWDLTRTRNLGYPALRWQKPGSKPEVQTYHIPVIRSTSMTASGNLIDPGSSRVAAYGFVWNTTGSPERGKDDEKDFGGSDHSIPFTYEIPDLRAGTRLYIRAFAANENGLAYGNELTATTVPYGGSGTEKDPYRISATGDLKYLGENDPRVTWPIHYVLAGDIAFSEADFSAGGAFHHGGEGFLPIGSTWKKRFHGIFDGAHHSIRGIKINRPDSTGQGFFGYADNAQLKNIRLLDVQITGNKSVGGLVGSSFEGMAVSDCSVTGAVSGNESVGGLVGMIWNGKFNHSVSQAKVTGVKSVGGLVGSMSSFFTIENSYATGTIEGDEGIGGLLGSITYGRLSNCFATGNVNGKRSSGGLVGVASRGHLSGCYASGNVNGEGNLGGLIGVNGMDTLVNAYARGSVTGKNIVGGLIGTNTARVAKTYATGKVTGNSKFGGLIGSDSGSVLNSFWDYQAANEDLSNGGAAKSTAQMKNIATFTRKNPADLSEAWDFAGDPNDDTAHQDIWALTDSVNNGYPYIKNMERISTSILAHPVLPKNGSGALRCSRIGRHGMVLSTDFMADIHLSVLNPLGKTVLTLQGKSDANGKTHSFHWNEGGNPMLASGRYVARLRVVDKSAQRSNTQSLSLRIP